MTTKNAYKSTFSLTPIFLEAPIEKRMVELKELQHLIKQSLNPEINGKIRASKKYGRFQYYLIQEPGDKEGKYIPRAKEKVARTIVQQEYLKKMLRATRHQLKLLEKFQKKWRDTIIDQVFTRLPTGKKLLVTPLIPDQKTFVENWIQLPYEKYFFTASAPAFYTSHGDRVRSKSEIIIADTLYRMKIPYRYEFPISLQVNGEKMEFHPDFYCLNVRTRKEYLWEHFGLLDNPDYAEKVCEKMKIYGERGLIPGENLIITMESQKTPLDSKQVELLVERWLL